MATATDQELVERVAEITGASLTEAEHLLGACSNNAESAIALFFEKGGAEDVGNGNVTNPPQLDENNEDNDEVRAPIVPYRQQLIGPGEDNFLGGISATAPRFVRPSQRVKICPLRDFAREGALMEEQLQAAYNGVSTSSGDATLNGSSRRRARAAFVATSVEALENAPPGSSRLGDLYRPPTDIAYAGTFQAARQRATAVKHWLLVNVQNDNFDSQLLNRDVWSNKELRKLVRKHFILWQIDSESVEGRRFIAFYHCNKLPYVCIIDPRTGEEIWKSPDPKESKLLNELKNFVLEHNDFGNDEEEESPTTSKRAAIVCDGSPERITDNTSKNPEKRSKVMELSEEEQLELAIKNSMHENSDALGKDENEKMSNATSSSFSQNSKNGYYNKDDNGEVENTISHDDDTKTTSERLSYKEKLGDAKDDLTTLKLRLLNSKGDDETVQLCWPSDTRLEVLRLYLKQKHHHLTQRSYKLICAFPRKTLSARDDLLTLKELGLHPSANVHVTDDD